MSSSCATSKQLIGQFVSALSSKQPTPGGGAAAAVGAAVGAAAAQMAAAYTMRKKDEENGAAARASALIAKLDLRGLIDAADSDSAAYADLQRTWKEADMLPEEKRRIESQALAVPVSLLERCHECIVSINEFLPDCNPSITSDAKVGIHLLAGAARASYQTVLMNSPSVEEAERLRSLLKEIRSVEDCLLELD